VSRKHPGGIPLTPRQRDFLATYPDEVMVWVVEHRENDGAIRLYANSEYTDAHREMWVPPEGFLAQPTVRLAEVTDDLDDLPEVPHPYEKE
jgi:hypothetical protein